jgi:hypothetical protein
MTNLARLLPPPVHHELDDDLFADDDKETIVYPHSEDIFNHLNIDGSRNGPDQFPLPDHRVCRINAVRLECRRTQRATNSCEGKDKRTNNY